MSEFEERLANARKCVDSGFHSDAAQSYTLIAIAEGLAELIGLLRPVVEAIAEECNNGHEPLTLCYALPSDSQDATKACVKSKGHDGMHADYLDTLWSGFESEATTEEKITRPQRCGALGQKVDRGAWGVKQAVCGRATGHDGSHKELDGRTW